MLRTTCFAFVLFASSIAIAKSSSRAAIKADYDNLCNALERSGVEKDPDKSMRAQKIADYLQKTLKTPEVKGFLGKLASLPAAERGPGLKKAAAEAGYTGKCPFADAK